MEEIKPVNSLSQRHGKWYVTPKPKSFIYSGYTAYYVKGNIFGFSEDIDVEAIVYQSEYYAK
jgi:hypothetical protein